MSPIEHICTCLVCRPDLFPPEHRSDHRTSDRHFAIRWWQQDATMRVHCDDVLLRECDEAMAGADGWAIVCTDDETGRVHYCGCGSRNIYRSVVRGSIRVEIVRVIV